MHQGRALSLQILQGYYPVVKTLGDYLRDVVVFDSGHATQGLTHETDTLAYRKLLKSCVVASTTFEACGPLHVTPPMGHLHEVRSCVCISDGILKFFEPSGLRASSNQAAQEYVPLQRTYCRLPSCKCLFVIQQTAR